MRIALQQPVNDVLYENATIRTIKPSIQFVVAGPSAEEALRELRSWRKRYGAISELKAVVADIDRALNPRRRRTNRPP